MKLFNFILITQLCLLPLSVTPLQAQGNLAVDPGEDAFQRAKNIYANAITAKNPDTRRRLLNATIPQLENYVKQFPKHKNTPAAYYYLAFSCAKNTELPRARELFKYLIRTYKKGIYVTKAARYMADDARIGKRYKEAVEFYGVVARLATKPSEYLEAYYCEGICHQILENPPKATVSFKTAISKSDISSIYYQLSHVKLGHIYHDQKNFKEALAHFTAVAKKESNHNLRAESTFYKGVVLAKLKKFKESRAAYNEVLKLSDKKWKPQALVAIMSVRYAEGDYQGVLKAVEQVEGVKFTGALMAKKEILQGKSYLKLKEYRKAVQSFSKVETRYPDTEEAFEAHYRKILCYYNLKSSVVTAQVNVFMRKYGKQYRAHQYTNMALMLQAETQFDVKLFKEAALTYEKINLKLLDDTSKASVLYKKAWCYSELKRYREAVQGFTDFLTAYPANPLKAQVYALRAQNYVLLKNFKNALADYKTVIKLMPNTRLSASAQQASARVYKLEGKFEEMTKQYEELLQQKELSPVVTLNAHYWVAWGYFKQDQYKKSLPHLTEAKKLDKGTYKKQLSLLAVLCYYQLKDKDESVKAVKEANTAGIANDIPLSIYRWLGILCYKSGEFSDAQTFLSLGVTKLNPNDTPVYYWRLLAKCQYENKDYKWALQSITHAINLETDEGHIVNMELYKALCQHGEKKSVLALATATAALKKNPTGKTKAMLLQLCGDIHYQTQNYKDAAINYASITDFYEDSEILPYAIAKIVKSLEASNKPDDAAAFKKRLKNEFPDYKLPE